MSGSYDTCACGGRKAASAKVCQSCRNAAHKSILHICPVCGGKKALSAQMCHVCRDALRVPKKNYKEYDKCICGRLKTIRAEKCIRCRDQARAGRRFPVSLLLDLYASHSNDT